MNNPDTEWLGIPGFPSYEINCAGHIRRAVDAPGGRYKKGRHLHSSFDTDGYLQVPLCESGKEYTRKVHTLVCLAFHGAKPTMDHEVRHLDGVKTNVHPSNLRWGTSKENHDDQVLHGTDSREERNPRAILRREQVDLIRADYARELKGRLRVRRGWYADTQKRFDVSRSLLANVVTGRRWNKGTSPRPVEHIEKRWTRAEADHG